MSEGQCADYFCRGKERSQCHVNRGLTGEINVMHRPDDAARGIEQNVQINYLKGHSFMHDAEKHKDVGNHDGRKQLQEVLHPQMDYPKAPEIRCSEV